MEVLWTHFTNDTSAVCFYGSDLHCCINGKQSCRATTTVRLFIRPSSTTLLESHIVTTNICENWRIDQFDQRPWIQFEGSEGRRCWNEVAVRATHSIVFDSKLALLLIFFLLFVKQSHQSGFLKYTWLWEPLDSSHWSQGANFYMYFLSLIIFAAADIFQLFLKDSSLCPWAAAIY